MAASPPVPPRAISPADAATEAWDLMRARLFPFQFNRWIVLGVFAFLDQCGRSGAASPRFPHGSWGNDGPTTAGEAGAWFLAHLALVALVVLGVLLVAGALALLALWIGSRGTFMYIDAVRRDSLELGTAWTDAAAPAGSYFRVRVMLAAAVLVPALLLMGAGGATVVAILRHSEAAAFTFGTVAAILILVLVPVALGAVIASVLLRDFVAPLQVAERVDCRTAVRVLVPMMRATPTTFLLYLALKIVFMFAMAVVVLVGCCVTCCCGLLPVVHQTLFQPFFWFERAWSLCLLRQMGFDLLGSSPQS